MKVLDTFAGVRAAAGPRSVLVPTMGYLHDGHLALIAAGRDAGEPVVMSLFVNPLQFDEPSDLDRYPRDFDRDAGLAEATGVDILFAPSVEEMYPEAPLARVHVARITDTMEGVHRPGHFDGVATVVTKLLAGLRPAVAVFGRKDAQQLAVVRRVVVDLSLPVEITAVPTVREPDGLALSSRNVLLDAAARPRAVELSRALFAASDAAALGEKDASVLESSVRRTLEEAEIEVDYVSLVDAAMAEPIDVLDREAFLALAATVGGVRLIDNVFLWPDGAADRGTTLDGPSMIERS